MNARTKNRILFLLFSIMTGAAIGIFLWCFLRFMNLGITFLWTTLPGRLDIPFYPVILCLIGGLMIGLFQKRYGAYPEEMDVVLSTLKKTGKYPYDHLLMLTAAALLPLLFGGSIGPEAGMTGIIIGLCCWAGDRFSYMGKNLRDITQMGVSATLGVIFHAPLFGFMLPIEEAGEEEPITFPKRSKMVIYFAAILGGFGANALLSSLFGGGAGLPHLSDAQIGGRERLFVIPLALAGVAGGFIYYLFHTGSRLVFGKLREQNLVVVSVMTGALFLGLVGCMVPISMFSGEEQMEVLIETYQSYAPAALIGIGVLKLLLTNVCIQSGWRGGHFFPIIFAGISIGYGCGMLAGVNPAFAVAVVTAGLMGYVMRKPMAVVLLLMLCLPLRCIVWMLVAACVGSVLPVPGQLQDEQHNGTS